MAKENLSQSGKSWLKQQTKPYRGRVVLLAVLNVFATVLSLAFAYLVRYLINSASDKNERLLWIFSGVVLGVLLLRILLQTVCGYFAEKLRARITADLRTKTFSKILRSDYSKLQEYHSGDLLSRLTMDIQEVSSDTVGLLPAIVGMIVQCFGAIGALLTIDVWFTLLYVVCGCTFGGITAFFRKTIKKYHKDMLQTDAENRSFMQESVVSVMTLKAYGAETKTTEKADGLANLYYKKRMKRNALSSFMGALFSLLSNFGLILAVVWCSVSVLNDSNPDYGSILSIILLLMQLQHPLKDFSSIMPVYYARMASAERLNEIEKIPCENVAKNDVATESDYENLQEICFDDVSFHYGRESVLENVTTRFKKGEIVCLTGASGSGKSTLFKLLLNVYTAQSGEIYSIDEVGEKTALTAQRRGLFAYVPQGNFLFSGTIYENLTFFSSETDKDIVEKRLESAIKVACAEFVYDLPQGLQTPLTEGGGGLSEGQTQRLAVARAILSNHPILLLDEATSALDSETEKRLLENVRALQDKTCLIVTHRPAALAIADTVLCIEKGRISAKEN